MGKMVDRIEFPIYEWETRLRAIKRVTYSNVHPDQTFRVLLVSADLGEAIGIKRVDESGYTFEGTPIQIDNMLPVNSAVYIPSEPASK